ncbi:ester cyclase [Falsiroseomonas sp. E2-1-a4]|uniref:ester cyclase n=1 Tax=Falsiroseomonas sp. E2-1-a4 TaxID=3239299 RepID=UPI003F38AE8B
MPPPSPGSVLRLWFEEVWNQRDPDRIATYFAPDAVAYALDESGADAHGPEAFRVFFERFLGSFSDLHFTLHEVVEAGPMAVARWSASLTHSGNGLGIAPTGASLTVTGMTMARVEDGMIREGWNEWDRLRLATGCGMLVPAG